MYAELLAADLQTHCDILESSYDALPHCTRELQSIYSRYTRVIVCSDLSEQGHGQLQICLGAARAASIQTHIFLDENLLAAYARSGTLHAVSIPGTAPIPARNYLRSSDSAAAFGDIANSLAEAGVSVELESMFFRENAQLCSRRLRELLTPPVP